MSKASSFVAFTRTGLLVYTGKLISESSVEQTDQEMNNMGVVFEAAGTSFDNVVKTTLLLAEIEDFKEVNAVYSISLVACDK